MITYLWEFAWYHIFTKWDQNIVVDESKECYAVMNAWMFHIQNHICKSWKELRKKLEHNKKAEKLNELFGRNPSSFR